MSRATEITSNEMLRRSRKLVALLLVACCALFLAACGDDKEEEDRMPSSSAPATTTTESTTSTADAGPEDVDGKTIFSNNCSSCHGATGGGGNGGPAVNTGKLQVAAISAQITNGGGGMPAFGGQLSEEEITALAEYVASMKP